MAHLGSAVAAGERSALRFKAAWRDNQATSELGQTQTSCFSFEDPVGTANQGVRDGDPYRLGSL
jgi:hypothetical protein